jgi:hypothetical protein
MFIKLTAIFLLVAFAAQTFSKAFLVLDYYSNTASFAKDCENKSRPLLNCNGKCLLMKKIKAAEKKEEQNPERKMENKNEIFFSAPFLTTLTIEETNIESNFNFSYSSFFPATQAVDIFHPPSLV